VEIFYDDEFPAAKSLRAFLQAAAEAGVDPGEAHDALEWLDIDDLMARIKAFDEAAQDQGPWRTWPRDPGLWTGAR